MLVGLQWFNGCVGEKVEVEPVVIVVVVGGLLFVVVVAVGVVGCMWMWSLCVVGSGLVVVVVVVVVGGICTVRSWLMFYTLCLQSFGWHDVSMREGAMVDRLGTGFVGGPRVKTARMRFTTASV